ncbi:hypothetical protein Dimus_006218, partial [Dionaea muscipula]
VIIFFSSPTSSSSHLQYPNCCNSTPPTTITVHHCRRPLSQSSHRRQIWSHYCPPSSDLESSLSLIVVCRWSTLAVNLCSWSDRSNGGGGGGNEGGNSRDIGVDDSGSSGDKDGGHRWHGRSRSVNGMGVYI